MSSVFSIREAALNAICPYFTMFPLGFPLSILRERARVGEAVLDPFCGRGTTNFAARLLGLPSLGVDVSPVAVAITAAKLVSPSVEAILAEARQILREYEPRHIPTGEFWDWAYHPKVLETLCRFREAFLEDCTTEERIALRGILLGALHGPKQKSFPSYLSNQSPRTYAPKPNYAVRFWKERGLLPEFVDVLAIIERRAKRYYEAPSLPKPLGVVRLGDSRDAQILNPEPLGSQFHWVITSPPYYGMSTYIPDQWLRNWFLGGPDSVDYTQKGQISHTRPEEFSANLRQVWRNVWQWCTPGAHLIIRFGSIGSRRSNPLELIQSSLLDSGWKIIHIFHAGSAANGRRQADSFLSSKEMPREEYDIWAKKEDTRN